MLRVFGLFKIIFGCRKSGTLTSPVFFQDLCIFYFMIAQGVLGHCLYFVDDGGVGVFEVIVQLEVLGFDSFGYTHPN